MLFENSLFKIAFTFTVYVGYSCTPKKTKNIDYELNKESK